jgi:hypothetical protein
MIKKALNNFHRHFTNCVSGKYATFLINPFDALRPACRQAGRVDTERNLYFPCPKG